MALNTKGKKTSLDEKAFIYEKRDEEESEKSKWSKMNRQQKKVHFKTYYLRPVLIVFAVLVLVGFFIYKDVIMKKDIVYRCAILNERALDGPVSEFGDAFVDFLKLNPSKNLASFHMYYTDPKLAKEVGASSATDLTQISSTIYASVLDSMIAAEEYFTTYMEHDFFVDLSTILNEKELETIKDSLYIPDTDANSEKHPYGIYLDGSSVYHQIFKQGGGAVEKPIFGIIFNSENKERSRQFLYYVFPELRSVTE